MKSAVESMMRSLMKEMQVQIDAIQDAIQLEFPSCEHIDLEFNHVEEEKDTAVQHC